MSTLGTKTTSLTKSACVLTLGMLASGCQVGPRYVVPPIQAPPAYKELTPAELAGAVRWSAAIPADAMARGHWWEIFLDLELNALETGIVISNQNIASAAANCASARAMVPSSVKPRALPSRMICSSTPGRVWSP